MGTRRKAREAALQMLYQMDVSAAGVEQVVELYHRFLAADAGAEETREPTEQDEFSIQLVRGVSNELSAIDEIIRGVSQHWRLERMSRVDRNILRLATYELMRLADVPRRVTLNEAVELAKRYGSDGSAGFVNGVLDRIASDLHKA